MKKIICPFICYGEYNFDCVYMINCQCDDIDICPGNSDSFCGNLVWDELKRLRVKKEKEDDKKFYQHYAKETKRLDKLLRERQNKS